MAEMDPADRPAWAAEMREHADNLEVIAAAIRGSTDNLALAGQSIGETVKSSTHAVSREAANFLAYAVNWLTGRDSAGADQRLEAAAQRLRAAAHRLSTMD